MPARSRRKGADGEREVARIFSDAGYSAIRTAPLESGGIIGDVTVEGIGTVEVKRGGHVPESLYRWLDGKGARLLVVRRDRQPWLVVQRLDDWLECHGSPGSSSVESGDAV